eukprot:TRINITY_DN1817_c0_g1_i3.p1 TRINITY_DN1817_c0_g1~~TRINITY_DN1817_c0_g1_i3.p1  ORF type:complete len:382 (+),score=-1.24 TRINITY_DN1817_c0_g1_i3:161-1147(+)
MSITKRVKITIFIILALLLVGTAVLLAIFFTLRDRSPDESTSSKYKVIYVDKLTTSFSKQTLVMSYNIRYEFDGAFEPQSWDTRKPYVLHVINEHSPDIMGLQEVTASQYRFLKASFPKYASVFQPRDGPEGEGVPIFYKNGKWHANEKGTFWLSDTPDVFASKSFGNSIPRVVTWARLSKGNTSILVLNTHYDLRGIEVRIKSSQLVIERIKQLRKNNESVILMGDLNTVVGRPELDLLVEEGGLKDTYKEYDKMYATVHRFRGNVYGRKIDYIFTSSDIVPIDFTIDRFYVARDGTRIYPSDHFPIISTLGIHQVYSYIYTQDVKK